MTFKRLQELVRLADLEYKDSEILKVRKDELVEAIADARDTIARLEAELKTTRMYNSSLTAQLHKAVMQDKGVYLESLG